MKPRANTFVTLLNSYHSDEKIFPLRIQKKEINSDKDESDFS